MQRMKRQAQRQRSGAVAVEFALVAPVFLVLLLGMLELGRAFEMQQVLSSAVREGARFAAMDRDGIVPENDSTNNKIINDVRNYLNAAGFPGDLAQIAITEVDNPNLAFDLDHPANHLRLFRLSAELPFSAVSLVPAHYLPGYQMKAEVVFRNARSTIVQ